MSLLSTYFQGMLLGILTNGIVLAIVLTLWLAPSKHSKSDNINDGKYLNTFEYFGSRRNSTVLFNQEKSAA